MIYIYQCVFHINNYHLSDVELFKCWQFYEIITGFAWRDLIIGVFVIDRVMYTNQSWLEIINIRVNIQFALSCGEGQWRQRSTKGFTEHPRHVFAICNSIWDSANYVVRSLVMYVMIFVLCTRYYTNM